MRTGVQWVSERQLVVDQIRAATVDDALGIEQPDVAARVGQRAVQLLLQRRGQQLGDADACLTGSVEQEGVVR